MSLIIKNLMQIVGIAPAEKAGPIPVGKIPDDATQIKKSAIAVNQTSIIHTVTANKTFYLSLFSVYARNSETGDADFSTYVTNAADAVQYDLTRLYLSTGTSNGLTFPFLPPLEIAAGWKVKIQSEHANIRGLGFVHGYEI